MGEHSDGMTNERALTRKLNVSRKLKRLVPALLLLVGVLYAARVWWRTTHIHGFIIGVAPVGNGQSVVCMRANSEYGFRPRAWIGLFDARREAWIWSEPMTGLSMTGLSGLSSTGLRIHEGRVIVRSEEGYDPQNPIGTSKRSFVSSYSLADGKRHWESTLSKQNSGPHFGFDLVVAGNLVLIASQDTETLTALELSSGRERWSKNMSEVSGNPRVVANGNSLLLDYVLGRTTVMDLQSGAARTLPAIGCVDNGRLIHLEQTAEGFSVVASNLSDQGHRVVADVPLPDAWKGGRVAACTRYGDRFVFFFTKEYIGGELAMIDATEPTARGSFYPLGFAPDSIDFETSPGILGTALSASGVVSRFIVLREKDALVVVDVQERRMVRRTKAMEAHRRVRSFRREDATFIVARSYPDLRIARIDGASGMLTAAACSDDDVELPSPFHIQGDEFWLHSGRWTGAVELTVLNATTLKPSGPNPLAVKDCLAETAALWGL